MQSKKELKNKYGDRKIYIVPFDRVADIKDGYVKLKHSNSLWSCFDNDIIAVKRYDAEGNPSMQQIMPYIIIANDKETSYFITERVKEESRLNGKLAIGCGGHMDETDGNREVLFKSTTRKLMEEVNAYFTKALEIIGTVRDLKSNTNAHLGVVIKAIASEEIGVSIKETDVLKGQWMSIDDLVNRYEDFEPWSKLIIDNIIEYK